MFFSYIHNSAGLVFVSYIFPSAAAIHIKKGKEQEQLLLYRRTSAVCVSRLPCLLAEQLFPRNSSPEFCTVHCHCYAGIRKEKSPN